MPIRRPDPAPEVDRGDRTIELAALGIDTTRHQRDLLDRYLALLSRWNTVYNLTAVRDPDAMWHRHVVDCAAAWPAVQRRLERSPARRIADVGSGGGLPGVVWAILSSDAEVTCIDKVGKKAAFVTQVGAALGLARLHARHSAVERLRGAEFDIVTSRAFASLRDFTDRTIQLLAPGGCWVAMKGKRPNDEIAELPPGIHMFHVEPLSLPGSFEDRCLVWMEPATTVERDRSEAR